MPPRKLIVLIIAGSLAGVAVSFVAMRFLGAGAKQAPVSAQHEAPLVTSSTAAKRFEGGDPRAPKDEPALLPVASNPQVQVAASGGAPLNPAFPVEGVSVVGVVRRGARYNFVLSDGSVVTEKHPLLERYEPSSFIQLAGRLVPIRPPARQPASLLPAPSTVPVDSGPMNANPVSPTPLPLGVLGSP